MNIRNIFEETKDMHYQCEYMNLHFSHWCVLMTLTNNIKTRNLICMQKVYIMHYNLRCLRSSDMVYQHSYVHSHCYNFNLDIFELKLG